ncbi:MAG: hypothetical protein B7C54_10975 [Acidimicrobiales bacterium mtb01]|nr:hypothetical protein [Actinomycetota bacterium]TEX45579.1 MAG: hypothetical protein B7C54_10975 [Acidimicrobiales bacterium mtb01]
MRGSTRLVGIAAALGIVLAGAACGGNAGGDDTLAPLPTAPGSSSSLAPLVSTTTVPEATTTTSIASTTTTVVPGLELILRSDGIGDARFGVEPNGVVEYVKAILGAPDRDTGWIDSLSEFGSCPGTEVRAVEWANLRLLFGDESNFNSGRRHFYGWQYGPPIDSEIAPLGPATDGGITVGSTVRDIVKVYPDVELYNDELFGPGFEIEATLTGTLSDDAPSGLVLALYGGTACGE